VIRRLEEHLATFVGPEPGALVFTAPRGDPLARSLFSRRVLRHSFVAILVAAERPEVSEWAGHNSVAFTLTRYGGLFENGSEAAVDRLDLLLGDSSKVPGNVLHLDTRKLR
jgi:integrase